MKETKNAHRTFLLHILFINDDRLKCGMCAREFDLPKQAIIDKQQQQQQQKH